MLTVKQSVVMRRNKLDIILATDKNHGGKKQENKVTYFDGLATLHARNKSIDLKRNTGDRDRR